MSIEPNHNELLKAEALIDQIVQVDRGSVWDSDLDLKLDLLERTIELIRIKRKKIKNKFQFEDYLQSDLFADDRSIRFSLPENPKSLGSGSCSIYYQPKLLLFLLLYHREKYQVINIIELFIDKIWDDLKTLDFKKTDTGVFRCYTNIRFAAKTLRDFGLIRFTRKEAYKTWELSLLGFLVASIVLEQDQCKWEVYRESTYHGHFLQSNIVKAIINVKDYDNFVFNLQSICQPDSTIFNTFEGMLKSSYELLEIYQKILKRKDLNKKQRQEKSSELITKLESLPFIDEFYDEFSKCINVNRILKTL